jgi:hypothetical protein
MNKVILTSQVGGNEGRVSADMARNHDHYIHGVPKR